MARTRRARAELTESWEDVDNSYFDGEGGEDVRIYDEEDERDELGSQYSHYRSHQDSPRRRTTRSTASVEPELVMPASPDAGRGNTKTTTTTTQRAGTPHFRMNQRSMTSDAGEIRRKQRTITPRRRMADRSMTSDAGRINGSRLREEQEVDSDDETAGTQYPTLIWRSAVHPLLRYVFDVVGYSLQYMKPLLGWLLLAYFVFAALVFGSGFLTNSINNALSPICRLPLTSSFSFCPAPNRSEPQGPAPFDKLSVVQSKFEDVLAGSAVGQNLPLDMKRTESGIRDLKLAVQHSSLPSRNELVFEFGGFIDTARQASGDLSKFNSRIGRAVDKILSTNRWTLSVIQGVSAQEASAGIIPTWVSRNLNIFAPFQPLSLSRSVLLDQYLRHTGAVEEQIKNLIDEAFVLRDILDNLEGRLDVIADIAERDGIKTASHQDELFAQLWTKLGGNRASAAKLKQQLSLLNDVTISRRQAWGHVTTTILKLQAIQHSLDDLRERVAAPQTVGTDEVPLEVHIESINLGIERLESQRDSGREIAAKNLREITSKAESGERNQIEGKEL